MNGSTTRSFTPARLVALTLITVLLGGLAYLRLAPNVEPITVPNGAKAGDLTLEPCEYAGEDGRSYAADCGTLVVAENPADEASRLIALPVTRVRALSGDPGEPVFFLTGGPGQSNMDYAHAERYAADRDVVLVGYRGIDGSVRLDCPEVDSSVKRSTDVLSDEFFRAYADGYRACADRLTADGIDPARYGLVQQIDDVEVARQALGYDRINLLSESAGTRTAIIYSWRFPEHLNRSVMIGVNPPGAFLWDADMTDEQIGRFAELCAADASCRARTDDLAATMRQTAADIPDRWLFLPIKESNVRVLSLFGLFETAPTGAASAPMMIDTWLSAAEGDASGFWFASVLADLMLPDLFVRGQYASAAMLDAQAARDYFASGPGDLTNLGRAATASGWGGGRMADGWPPAPDEEAFRQVRTSEVETLVINGELDVSTPPQAASRELMPYLPNGQEVVLPGLGHTESFFNEQPEAGTQLITAYFASGEVDDSLYVPQSVDFTPPTSHGGLAKAALGIMLGVAAVAVLSLIAMARRVQRNGRIGQRSGALLRSVYPVVLALGGWFIGALLVWVALPGVRIDNGLLVVLSIGVPVGLGVWLAWVDRDRPAEAKSTGMALAAAGAVLGAWLGSTAVEGFFALFTAIIGATAGANLMVITLDIYRARRGAAQEMRTRTHVISRDEVGTSAS